MIRKIVYLSAFLIVSFSCSNNSNYNKAQTGKAKLVCEKDYHDFGTVKAGGKLTHTYIIKNEGDADLLILKVEPSCGCTVADYDDDPIKPGETGEIKIVFNTKGRKGMAYKDITVKSNAENETKTLSFKANIIDEENKNE